MRRHGKRPGFTLVELLVVIALISILAAILFPAFAQARAKALSTACLSHCREIGMAICLYSQDYEEAYPLYAHYPNHDQWWYEVIQPYTRSQNLFACPAAPPQQNSYPISYGVNYLHVIMYGPGWSWTEKPDMQGPARLASLGRPAETIMVADSQIEMGPAKGQGWPALYCLLDLPYGPTQFADIGEDKTWGLSDRHEGGGNYIFADGHAKWLRRQTVLDWSQDPARELWGHYH